jgi:protein-disulfide isomerase
MGWAGTMKGWSIWLAVAALSTIAIEGWHQTKLARTIARIEGTQTAIRQQLDNILEQSSDSERSTRGRGRGSRPLYVPEQPVSTATTVITGAATARVAVIEFADYHCPFCRRYAQDTAPLIQREFVQAGRIKYMLWPLPLEGLHPKAFALAIAAECANRQGRFWPMQERLFGAVRPATLTDAGREAAALGLNSVKFATCQGDKEIAARIGRGVEMARELQVTSTPTFFLGKIESDGRVRVVSRLAGAQPYPVFKSVLERLLRTE